MNQLKQLKPENVFRYFEEICNIPHGSGNTKEISDYCVAFAQKHQLEYVQDEWNNVIIIKEASKGYESSPTIILQGHMDMVCEKDHDYPFDFEKEGLHLQVADDWIFAQGTTLGGDDGIAVAYALAILEDSSLQHPRLEILLTVDEETGMYGAAGIDTSSLQGKCLLNLDSEEEGYFLTSCAGGLTAHCQIPVSYENTTAFGVLICIDGLQGGHSGVEIHKERGNAIVLFGRLMRHLNKTIPYSLSLLEGGLKDNAIPRQSQGILYVEESNIENLKIAVQQFESMIQEECKVRDPKFYITVKELGIQTLKCLSATSKESITFMLRNIPNGVQSMNRELQGLVESSLNVGIMNLKESFFELSFSVRSSIASKKDELRDKLFYLTEFLGGTCTVSGDYPPWEYRSDSKLREIAVAIYCEMYQKEPTIQEIHAGLECGLLSGKIKDLDCISFGPNMCNIHTPQEKLSISSTKRVYEYLICLLEKLK